MLTDQISYWKGKKNTVIFLRGYTQQRSFNNSTFLSRHQKQLQMLCLCCMREKSALCSKATCHSLNRRWCALHLKQVVYWEDDTKPETMGKVRVPWNQTSVTVSGLAGNTQYFLTVSAFNTAGTGPFLPAINVTTKKPRKLQHPRCAAAQVFDFVSTLIIIQRCS